MRIYISGPMTDYENLNFPAFYKAEEKIKDGGHIPLNPASAPAGLEYQHYMDIAFAMIRSSNAILMLEGWQRSKGATAEAAYAKATGVTFVDFK